MDESKILSFIITFFVILIIVIVMDKLLAKERSISRYMLYAILTIIVSLLISKYIEPIIFGPEETPPTPTTIITGTIEGPTPTPTPTPMSQPGLTSSDRGFTSVGNTVTFGRYEQDNNTSDGAEPIYWKVLEYDRSQNRVLVLSVSGLHTMQYHYTNSRTAWADTAVRNWLNGSFMNAFSTEERALILPTYVSNSYDYCFLLDADQIRRYLSSPYLCYATNRAIAEGAYINSDYGSSSWLVRTDVATNEIAWVGGAGTLYTPGGKGTNYLTTSDNVVRPAMWLQITP